LNKKPKEPIRIVVADDHSAVLASVIPILETHYTIVGTATDGKAAVAADLTLHPDVVVLDISMPVMSGIDAARQMRKNGSQAIIVFLTVHRDEDIYATTKHVGGMGYVVKDHLGTDLVFAIEEALEGRYFASTFSEH
jgi:DNA-binding NarL/FixJ family response regulator